MAVGVIIAKVAGAVLSNEKGRELVLVLITAILMPIIMLILVWIPLLSGTVGANVSLLDCCFKDSIVPDSFTDEQKTVLASSSGALALRVDLPEIKEKTATRIFVRMTPFERTGELIKDNGQTRTGGDKYVKKKNNGGYEVKFTAILDKRLGESDVRKVALHLAEVARTGAKNYIYCSGSKLFTPQMMGTGASIKNIVVAPDGTWISCEVDLTLKQCSKGDGSTGSSSGSGGGGGGGGGYKYSVTVYYSGSSGAVSSVTGYSNVSKEDARKKAWAKVPGNAQWASETKKQATNQTTNAKNAANTTTDNAKKDATKYVNDKVNTVKNGGGSSKVTTTKTATKAVRIVA